MLVVLNVCRCSNGVGVDWGLDVHLQLSAMGGAHPVSSTQPWMLSGILLPGASAQGLPHHSASGQGSRKWDLLGLTQSKWAPGSLTSFQEFLLLFHVYVVEELSHHLWLLLDAVQGVDILISGMDSRSFLITAVERKREILFSVLFNQFIQVLWPTGCFFSWLGTAQTFLMQFYECRKTLVSRTAWHSGAWGNFCTPNKQLCKSFPTAGWRVPAVCSVSDGLHHGSKLDHY